MAFKITLKAKFSTLVHGFLHAFFHEKAWKSHIICIQKLLSAGIKLEKWLSVHVCARSVRCKRRKTFLFCFDDYICPKDHLGYLLCVMMVRRKYFHAPRGLVSRFQKLSFGGYLLEKVVSMGMKLEKWPSEHVCARSAWSKRHTTFRLLWRTTFSLMIF